MFIESINLILIIFLSTIQSIIGIGVLVLGTPILLLINVPMLDTINFLLPVSIITSLLNIFIFKIKKNFLFNIERFKNFLIICLPFVFIGLILLKFFHKFLNFDYLVSSIIIISLIFRNNISKFLNKMSKIVNYSILMCIGIIHGLSNSGGSLLSLILINLNKSKSETRSEITLFYLLLVLVQFTIFCILFGFNQDLVQLSRNTLYIILGVILGNILIKFTKEDLYRKIVYILAIIASMSLIFKNIF